jgi:hypothetical protein
LPTNENKPKSPHILSDVISLFHRQIWLACVKHSELKLKSIGCDLIIAAIATLFMGGVALADSTIKTTRPASDASAKPADKGATGNGGMAGTPSAEKSSGVEG